MLKFVPLFSVAPVCPRDHDLYALESTLSKNASIQVLALMPNSFEEDF